MSKKNPVRYLALLLVFLTLISLCGCAGSTVRPSSNASEVVATAGGTDILYDEYYYLAMSRVRELKEAYKDAPLSEEALRTEVQAFLQENLLNKSHALIEIGLSYGIDIEKGEIAENVQAHMEGILADTFAGDRDAYVESLNENYLTDRYVRTVVAVENYLSVEIIKAMLERGELDDSDEAALRFLRGEDFIRVRQVVIKEQIIGDKTITSMEQAKAKAEKLRESVVNATDREDAMRTAMQSSLDMSDTTGDGIYFARGEMEESFEQAAFALAEYDVSEVLAVDGGYCFMMRLPKSDDYLLKNLESLKGKTYYIVLNEKLQTKLSAMKLEMTSFGKSLDPLDPEPIDAAGGEGIVAVIVCVSILLPVIAGVFVVRVLLLRRNVKKGVLPKQRKKTKKG